MQPDISHSLLEEFEAKLKLKEESAKDELKINLEGEDEDDEVELVDATDEEFSFVCGVLTSPIAAEEAFDNGQIRPFFPLFNKDLLLSDIDFEHLKNGPPVDKVFVKTEDNINNPPTTSNEEISGPYCEWSKKATINPAEGSCKKSNSTGFSKLWRFRDFINRSNSDGRDAFVFFNNTSSTVVNKGKISGDEGVTQNKKKLKKSEAVLAHEVYMKSKARDEERRRSYLPYRPDLVGFFTNVNGGLTRNVHPF
ncbi:hypothetical protein HAX54_004099 [Datura stramonium]|uniref:Uncharacterized protein n=1 Tax=Datura stramonium TaxID=4076 RepID=A0ABS8T6G1_DATST|nr:hypothetical protein [Datura stramonium]